MVPSRSCLRPNHVFTFNRSLRLNHTASKEIEQKFVEITTLCFTSHKDISLLSTVYKFLIKQKFKFPLNINKMTRSFISLKKQLVLFMATSYSVLSSQLGPKCQYRTQQVEYLLRIKERLDFHIVFLNACRKNPRILQQ